MHKQYIMRRLQKFSLLVRKMQIMTVGIQFDSPASLAGEAYLPNVPILTQHSDMTPIAGLQF